MKRLSLVIMFGGQVRLLIVAMMVAACGGQMSAQDIDYVPQRADYSFRSDVRAINDDGDVRWDSIIVYLTDAKASFDER